jgi:uncharacterized membrane protein YqjE
MNTNGRQTGKTPNVAASVSELTSNVIELTELQAQLLALDMKQSAQKARASLILAVTGVCVLLGTIPIILFALAYVLIEQAGWSNAAGLGFAALVGLVIAGVVLGVAWALIRKGLVNIERSREELRRNVAWLKSSLRSHGHAHLHERPINY